jgi:hypothetical protein
LTQTLQLEPRTIRELPSAPKLLVEWSPRWDEFVTSLPIAFARSSPRLAGEAPLGGLPYRGLTAAFLLQLFLVFVLMVLPPEIERLRPYATPRLTSEDVIYYSNDELPRTQDLSGAQSGTSGRAGGREAHHRTQTIHVARGSSLTQKVVDAPNLKLPSSSENVANLLAFKSVIPPPPAEGLHSTSNGPRLNPNVVAPSQTEAARDQSRRAPNLNASVIAPAPDVSNERSRTTPQLKTSIVAPAPTVQSDHTIFAPRLDASIIAPAPNLSRQNLRNTPSLSANVIAPASTNVSRNQTRSVPALNGTVIAPAPSDVTHEVSPSRVRMNNVAVVPPPVSAPERESGRNAKLNLPSPSVVAPPPSASDPNLRRLESGGVRSSAPNVIPPPPTQTANGSIVSSIIGKLFGTQDVVPPPPNVSSAAAAGNSRASINGGQGNSLNANVIPPPPSVGGAPSGYGGSPTGRAQAGSNVIPPPPAIAGGNANGSSGQISGDRRGSSLNASNVIPPPPSVGGSGSSSGSRSGSGQNSGSSSGNGTLLASNVIPPPPSAGSGSGLSGSGRRGSGLGGPGDIGSPLAPPKTPGTGDNSGVVLSTDPGSKPGMPGTGGKGSLALSPSGGDKPGTGGNGGGTGIGTGTGPGSGLTGEESGAGKTGAGRGSDLNARGGISPTPGSGGAGTSPSGTPAAPGVDVRGGSTNSIVTLPSFDSTNSNAPSLPGRSTVKADQGPSITIVATSRSGGAFDFYGKLPGDNYTVYVDTNLGTVVMQFAEADTSHPHSGALTGPSGMKTELPANLPHARIVVKCKLDASGNLKNFQVLEPGPAGMTAKIMAALPNWKFRPAMRGDQPVEVNAILGFNIDTNDRY